VDIFSPLCWANQGRGMYIGIGTLVLIILIIVLLIWIF
jgi:hypothetical protein